MNILEMRLNSGIICAPYSFRARVRIRVRITIRIRIRVGLGLGLGLGLGIRVKVRYVCSGKRSYSENNPRHVTFF